jgi:RimJ/RimL family protein N-acetyltransferase
VTFLRPVLRADREELARFECARPERKFEIDVEEFVRDAISWLEDPDGADREVLVLEDSGEIVGILMHEDDAGDRFINALAIRNDQQAKGLGTLVLGTVLDDLTERYAGHVATWLVAPANFASHAMSEAVGADVTYPADTKPNALYAIAL